jgi:hypothetical protein
MKQHGLRSASWRAILISMVAFSGLAFAQASGNATSHFLRSSANWNEVSVVFHQMGPLFGGLEVFLAGDGAIIIRRIRRSESREMEELRYQLREAERVQELLRRLEAADLLTMNLERGLPPLLDSGQPLLVLCNSAGEQRVFAPMGAPSKELEEILSGIISLESLASEAASVYQGALDTGYYPAGFEWVRHTLAPRRNIGWAPHATDEQIRKAEEEYQKTREQQLEEIRKRNEQRR